MTTETSKKKGTLQILKTDTALQLAEKWVAKMSKPVEDELLEAEQVGRPHRLGLGAKVSRQTRRVPSDDPLDQKLQAKFDAGRRKYARSAAESAAASGKNIGDDSEDDDESESKSRSLGKKRRITSTQS